MKRFTEYTVRAANSGPAALRLAATHPRPDLILLDLMMPGMDGYEVMRRLRDDAATREVDDALSFDERGNGAVELGVHIADPAAFIADGDAVDVEARARGTTYYFPHTVTNTGNYDDYVNLTASSAGGWTVAIYRDGNNNGTFEAGPDTLLVDSAGDADATPDSGLLLNDGFMRILVAVTVPAGTADGTGDVTTVGPRVASFYNPVSWTPDGTALLINRYDDGS